MLNRVERGFLLAVVLFTVGMLLAVVGRALDWSPFALVVSGGVLGFAVGVGITTLAYEVEADPEAPAQELWAEQRLVDDDGEHCGAVYRGYRCYLPAGHPDSVHRAASGRIFATWRA